MILLYHDIIICCIIFRGHPPVVGLAGASRRKKGPGKQNKQIHIQITHKAIKHIKAKKSHRRRLSLSIYIYIYTYIYIERERGRSISLSLSPYISIYKTHIV